MRRKLKGQSGASMLIALVFFFLCVTVGIIVLTAAASNSGQLSHVKEQRQAYLATSSAARLIREEMEKVSFTRITTTEECEHSLDVTIQYPDLTGPLAETIQDFCDTSDWGKRQSSFLPGQTKTLTISAKDLTDVEFPKVSAVFTSTSDLKIAVQFRIAEDPTSKEFPDHPLALTLSAIVNTTTDKSHGSHRVKATDDAGNDASYDCRTTITKTTTTITWTGDIGKGAVT